jgi:hypothetical protein
VRLLALLSVYRWASSRLSLWIRSGFHLKSCLTCGATHFSFISICAWQFSSPVSIRRRRTSPSCPTRPRHSSLLVLLSSSAFPVAFAPAPAPCCLPTRAPVPEDLPTALLVLHRRISPRHPSSVWTATGDAFSSSESSSSTSASCLLSWW